MIIIMLGKVIFKYYSKVPKKLFVSIEIFNTSRYGEFSTYRLLIHKSWLIKGLGLVIFFWQLEYPLTDFWGDFEVEL